MHSSLPIICAAITGLTLGLVLQHKSHIESQPSDHTAAAAAPASLGSMATEPTAQPYAKTAMAPQIQVHSSPAQEAQIAQLLEEIEMLKQQQANFNREVSGIQFRLDTHSQQFRPLRAENNSGVTSPIGSEFDTNLVLPPRF